MATNKTINTSFKAKADDGSEYEIVVSETVVSLSGLPEDEKPTGKRWIRTRDGKPVNHIGPGIYEIIDVPTIRLNTDDPAAQ